MEEVTKLCQSVVRNTNSKQGSSVRSEVLGNKLAELGCSMATNPSRRAVQAVPKTTPECCLVEQLHCLGGRRGASKLQLHSWDRARQLPWLESLDSNNSLVPSSLDCIQSVLPALGADHASPRLLQVPDDGESTVILGTKACCKTQCVGDPGIVISLIPGPSLYYHTQSCHRAMVLDGSDVQPTLQG